MSYSVKQMPRGDFLGSLEQIVMLAVLRLGTNAYGITVRREIEEQTGREISIGAVYATLERLEAKGYVSSFTGETEAERGGRREWHCGHEGEDTAARAGRTCEPAFRNRGGRTPGAERVTERAQEHVRRPQPPVEARMSPSTLALSQRILERLMPPAQAEALLGDLLEERRLRLQAGSQVSVAGWYWRQFASSVPTLLWASVRRGA